MIEKKASPRIYIPPLNNSYWFNIKRKEKREKRLENREVKWMEGRKSTRILKLYRNSYKIPFGGSYYTILSTEHVTLCDYTVQVAIKKEGVPHFCTQYSFRIKVWCITANRLCFLILIFEHPQIAEVKKINFRYFFPVAQQMWVVVQPGKSRINIPNPTISFLMQF